MELIDLYKGFVKCDGKKSLDKFKDVENLRTYDEVKDMESYGGVLKEDTILIDVDDKKQSEILMNIVEDMQLNCFVLETEHGRHFLFKNSQLRKCATKIKLAIGIEADIKVGYANSYEILRKNHVDRFLEWTPEGDVQELPKWMLNIGKNKTDFINLKDGDGRNQELFNYILVLNKQGFSKEESVEVLNIINKYVLTTPLSQSELDVITRDDAFPKETFFEKGKFLHNNFAIFLKNNEKIVKINNQLHIYENGCYVYGKFEIEAKMLKYIPTLKASQRIEVVKYLELICEEVKPADARYIAFNNCIYDVVNDEISDFTSDLIVVNKIPHDYVKDAYSKLCDDTLNKISCNDASVRSLLEESIGYAFYRRQELSKSFFLIGDGSNGKSTFLDMIKNLLGQNNISGLDVGEFDERFSVATLSGKLANIGDDISDDFLNGKTISVFKKIVSGNQIKAEYKGQDTFFFEPYVKVYCSANALPRTKSKGFKALLRRMVIIPFNATFGKSDADYDPFVTYKLEDEEVMQYLIQIGIDGLKRVLQNRGFTESAKVQKELDDFEIENNPILLWIQENPVITIINQETKVIHRKYKVFCAENGFNEMTLMNFSKELNKRFKITTKRVRVDGKLVSYYVQE